MVDVRAAARHPAIVQDKHAWTPTGERGRQRLLAKGTGFPRFLVLRLVAELHQQVAYVGMFRASLGYTPPLPTL
ncbi:MAG TPA: hypothetical protein VGC49_04140 [Solirubrobacterales bacterium]|jgi:hypothetical protein